MFMKVAIIKQKLIIHCKGNYNFFDSHNKKNVYNNDMDSIQSNYRCSSKTINMFGFIHKGKWWLWK